MSEFTHHFYYNDTTKLKKIAAGIGCYAFRALNGIGKSGDITWLKGANLTFGDIFAITLMILMRASRILPSDSSTGILFLQKEAFLLYMQILVEIADMMYLQKREAEEEFRIMSERCAGVTVSGTRLLYIVHDPTSDDNLLAVCTKHFDWPPHAVDDDIGKIDISVCSILPAVIMTYARRNELKSRGYGINGFKQDIFNKTCKTFEVHYTSTQTLPPLETFIGAGVRRLILAQMVSLVYSDHMESLERTAYNKPFEHPKPKFSVLKKDSTPDHVLTVNTESQIDELQEIAKSSNPVMVKAIDERIKYLRERYASTAKVIYSSSKHANVVLKSPQCIHEACWTLFLSPKNNQPVSFVNGGGVILFTHDMSGVVCRVGHHSEIDMFAGGTEFSLPDPGCYLNTCYREFYEEAWALLLEQNVDTINADSTPTAIALAVLANSSTDRITQMVDYFTEDIEPGKVMLMKTSSKDRTTLIARRLQANVSLTRGTYSSMFHKVYSSSGRLPKCYHETRDVVIVPLSSLDVSLSSVMINKKIYTLTKYAVDIFRILKTLSPPKIIESLTVFDTNTILDSG